MNCGNTSSIDLVILLVVLNSKTCQCGWQKSGLVVSKLNLQLEGCWFESLPMLDGNGVKAMPGSILAPNPGSFNNLKERKYKLPNWAHQENIRKNVIYCCSTVFLGLISDLFPSLDVPRKRELEFEKAVKHAACDLKLQPEESFVLKVSISSTSTRAFFVRNFGAKAET